MNPALRIATIVTKSQPAACNSGVLLAELFLKGAENWLPVKRPVTEVIL
jgi:hypothetical protein